MTVEASQTRSPFHIIAKPIGAICNIKCEYCFYLDKENLYDHPKRSDFRMAPDVLENYVQQYIEAQPFSEEVNFSWQGGEPTLLGLDFYRRAVAFQRKYTRSNQRVTNAFQTNGILLDDEWCTFLRDEGFLVGISIDGTDALHNRYRLDLEGRGTFKQVMNGLEALKRNKVEYNVLTVVQNDNGDHGAKVYRFITSLGATFIQFIPIVEHAANGGLTSRSVGPEQWGHFLNAVWDEWIQNDIGNVYIQHFDMMLGITLGYPASTCVHSRTCGKALAIEHNGDVYSCDHFVDPAFRIGNIGKTHLAVLVDGAQQTKFGRDKLDTLPKYCRECDYLKFCYGGCPAHRVKLTPDGDPNLNHLCEGYKLFYGHTRPALVAMAKALRNGETAREYQKYLAM